MKSVKEADMNNNRFKPFSTTLMGSMPRSKELLDLKEKSIKDDKYAEEYKEKVYLETEKINQMSEEVGIDVVVSGELARDNYMSYIAEHVPGVKLMTMEDINSSNVNSSVSNVAVLFLIYQLYQFRITGISFSSIFLIIRVHRVTIHHC